MSGSSARSREGDLSPPSTSNAISSSSQKRKHRNIRMTDVESFRMKNYYKFSWTPTTSSDDENGATKKQSTFPTTLDPTEDSDKDDDAGTPSGGTNNTCFYPEYYLESRSSALN